MVPVEVRSMTENTCWVGLGLIFRKMLTSGLQEGIKAVSWVINGPKLWLFENLALIGQHDNIRFINL